MTTDRARSHPVGHNAIQEVKRLLWKPLRQRLQTSQRDWWPSMAPRWFRTASSKSGNTSPVWHRSRSHAPLVPLVRYWRSLGQAFRMNGTTRLRQTVVIVCAHASEKPDHALTPFRLDPS